MRLLLLDDRAEPLVALGPLGVASTWWPDVEPVVAAARARWAVEVVVLRVLSDRSTPAPGDPAAGPQVAGGHVTYLAQTTTAEAADRARELRGADVQPLTAAQLGAALAPEPLRAAWARPGGPAAVVAWADAVLAARGMPRCGPVEQVKTWNLSSILRLPTASGPVWCKSVPPFLGHEARVIERVGRRHPTLVPRLLGADPATGSALLADVPGEDQWAAPLGRLLEMVRAVVDLQAEQVTQVEDLLALGLPDWRAAALVPAVGALAGRREIRAALTTDELGALDALVGALPRVATGLAACALPDTLVHGDLHAGNWRHGPGGLLLLDWGDSGVGHPLLDVPAFLERVEEPAREPVRRVWAERWRARYRDADPERAMALVGPLAALRQALVYQGFLDRIEPDEAVYHRGDVPYWLRRAIGEHRQLETAHQLV